MFYEITSNSKTLQNLICGEPALLRTSPFSMKKHFLSLAIIFCTLCSFTQQNKWFTIKAFLPRWNGAEVSLFSNNQLVYTGMVTKDMFDYTGNIGAPMQGYLKIKSGRNIFYIPVFLEPGTIRVRDAGSKSLFAYGTPANDIYIHLNRRFDSLAALQKNISFQSSIAYKRNLAGNFISNNPTSIISMQLLKEYYYLSPEASDSLYYSLVHSLNKELQETYYGREMIKEANLRYNTAIGRPAPNMQVKDTTGQLRSIYQSGEYTLVDFWASWCVPCRKENNQLKNVFQKYKSNGFNITSVSLDANRLGWITAIRQDKMMWNQLSDLKGFEGTAASVYGIKVIPMNYLVNKEGLIIAKNLYADQLDSMLRHLIDGVNF